MIHNTPPLVLPGGSRIFDPHVLAEGLPDMVPEIPIALIALLLEHSDVCLEQFHPLVPAALPREHRQERDDQQGEISYRQVYQFPEIGKRNGKQFVDG
jgi:hypothetical protein